MPPAAPSSWQSAWPDALAFALGLGVAWFGGWSTTDLVWSLWLSSFVVGYAILVWSITRPLRGWASGQGGDVVGIPFGQGAAGLAMLIGGSLFLLAFFTVHFGGFHLGHSVFLNMFFPLQGGEARPSMMPSLADYGEVAARYWWFLPAAFLAERSAFRGPSDATSPDAPPVAVPGKRGRTKSGDPMMAPYRNVVRMHLLIFFFAFAHGVKLDHFIVYIVVYAVYFFPWRLVKKTPAPA
jgi:hypothetical protein